MALSFSEVEDELHRVVDPEGDGDPLGAPHHLPHILEIVQREEGARFGGIEGEELVPVELQLDMVGIPFAALKNRSAFESKVEGELVRLRA